MRALFLHPPQKNAPPTEGAELLDTTGGIAGVPSLAQTMVGRN
jgi:hypothetical protein